MPNTSKDINSMVRVKGRAAVVGIAVALTAIAAGIPRLCKMTHGPMMPPNARPSVILACLSKIEQTATPVRLYS